MRIGRYVFEMTLELLIVEDEPEIQDIVESIVTDQNVFLEGVVYQVRVTKAKDGQEAFDLIQGRWFDAILSDIQMPRMDGLELLANIRGLGKEVPLVFLTAFGDKEHAVRALRLGCFDFLDKPINFDRLRDVIHRALENGYRGRAIEREIEIRLAKLASLPADRYRQLRLVFRSMILIEHSRKKAHSAPADKQDRTNVAQLSSLLGRGLPSAQKKIKPKKKKRTRNAA